MKWCSAGLVTWICLLMSALATADIPGSRDPHFLQRYPLSTIVEFLEEETPEYRLALGAMKKINGVIAPESLSSRRGLLTRVTYQVPDGHSSQQAFEMLVNQLKNESFNELYRCDGRACGSSNQWANAQFNIPRLYGLDREQHYAAFADNAGTAVAVYGVQRGNKRVYLQVDWIHRTHSEARQTLLQRLNRPERVMVQRGDSLEALADELKRLRAVQPTLELWLVGHSDQGSTTAERMQSALIDAKQLRERLAVLGVDETMLRVEGLGDLAPGYSADIPPRRIELLFLR